MSVEKKYKKLVETALQIIRVDDEIFKAIHAQDEAMEQIGYVNRSPLIAKIQTLKEWQEAQGSERVAIDE